MAKNVLSGNFGKGAKVSLSRCLALSSADYHAERTAHFRQKIRRAGLGRWTQISRTSQQGRTGGRPERTPQTQVARKARLW
jgi:hypothetical protein